MLDKRARTNLAMLEFVARKLEGLKDKLVFLGGCATALLINDPVAPDVRTTLDVDCIVDVISLQDYHQLEQRLTTLGFKQSMDDTVICRWRYQEIILDVIPTDEKILGFGNRWYKPAIAYSMVHQIAEDLALKSVTAPYFLATKFEAFKDRGNQDYLMSHDFEDIVAVIDGRIDLISEVKRCQMDLKEYLASTFSALLQNSNFSSSLPGHLNYGAATSSRTNIVLNRIKRLANIFKEEPL